MLKRYAAPFTVWKQATDAFPGDPNILHLRGRKGIIMSNIAPFCSLSYLRTYQGIVLVEDRYPPVGNRGKKRAQFVGKLLKRAEILQVCGTDIGKNADMRARNSTKSRNFSRVVAS